MNTAGIVWSAAFPLKNYFDMTIEEILYSAKALLRDLEQVDRDGVRYFEYEEAKVLKYLIEKYESQ